MAQFRVAWRGPTLLSGPTHARTDEGVGESGTALGLLLHFGHVLTVYGKRVAQNPPARSGPRPPAPRSARTPLQYTVHGTRYLGPKVRTQCWAQCVLSAAVCRIARLQCRVLSTAPFPSHAERFCCVLVERESRSLKHCLCPCLLRMLASQEAPGRSAALLLVRLPATSRTKLHPHVSIQFNMALLIHILADPTPPQIQYPRASG